MPLQRIEHYLVLSDDIEATKSFYCDLLGFEEGFRPAMRFPGYWLYLGEVPCIHIADWSSYENYGDDAGMTVSRHAQGTGPVDHIAFAGSDYEDMVRRLDGGNVEYQTNEVAEIGLRQVFVHDPNGLKIELNFA